ncbi:VPLPA-CTERM sorting domain-containing protein [Rubrimonas cliftonensis]|uniref:VPLPA-CTERM protein sorting domain-containing protein n=1 Tax=Rubrimonas cliftonensis TaxID=89524 RepID=A0A1H4FWJ1_9RHOB|nr:VPLPA-CTERM sorting domain-containing protein [Rubrimonas cliftonensis]SEB00872.1 VPLPA-CTERM protein sorting domain-containing protein [Rubrimonas cliftonensis]
MPIRRLFAVAIVALAPFGAGAVTVSLDLGRSADLLQNLPVFEVTFNSGAPISFGGGLVTASAFATDGGRVVDTRLRVRTIDGVSINSGLRGQPSNQADFVDTTEFLRFDFARPATMVSVGFSAASNFNGNNTVGDRIVELFSPQGTLLSRVAQTGIGGVFNLGGGLPLDTMIGSLILRPNGDGFRVSSLGFTLQPEPVTAQPDPEPPVGPVPEVAPVPLPAAAPLLLAALAGLGLLSRRSRSRGGADPA